MSEITPVGAAHGIDLLDTESFTPQQRTSAIARVHQGTKRLTQRGMSTAEYAVGILAAVSLALVLLRVVTDAEFFKVALKVVLKIMSWVGSQIK